MSRTRWGITAAVLCAVGGLAPAQPDGALWAPSGVNNLSQAINKVDPAGRLITSFVIPSFNPFGVATDAFGNGWFGSGTTTSTRVARVDVLGNVTGTFPCAAWPQSVACDASGNLWLACRTGLSVQKMDGAGNILTTTPLPGGAVPIGIIVDQQGNVWASEFGLSTNTTHSMFKLDATGTIVGTFPFGPNATPTFGFNYPSIDLNNDVWVVNQARSSVIQLNSGGGLINETPLGSSAGRGSQHDSLNFTWLAIQGFAGRVVKMDQSGTIVASIPPPPNTPQLSFTTCAIDGFGDPWAFAFTTTSTGRAIKLWQVDGTVLTSVAIPAGHSAYSGDAGGMHLAANLLPGGDIDNDTFGNLAEFVAGTNPMRADSTPLRPLPIQHGLPSIGTTIRLGLRLRSDAGLNYVMGASLGSTPGIVLPDSRVIPLNVDVMLLVSLTTPTIFGNFQGTLNATGDALANVNIPPDAGLVGFTFFVAWVSLDPAAPSGIRHISNALPITIQP
jgi:DNA-binding beta-propeller fold protein YncE